MKNEKQKRVFIPGIEPDFPRCCHRDANHYTTMTLFTPKKARGIDAWQLSNFDISKYMHISLCL